MSIFIRTTFLVGIIACVISGCDRGVDFKDTAPVVSSTPSYREVSTPRQECWMEEVGASSPTVEPQPGETEAGDIAEASEGEHAGQGWRMVAVPVPAERSSVAPLMGGLVGGLIGHQFGGGNGQALATVAGVVGGAMAGDQMVNGDAGQVGYVLQEVPPSGSAPVEQRNELPRQQQFCRTVEDRQLVANGYTVVYRYNGRDITVRLPYDPGSTVTVGVRVMR